MEDAYVFTRQKTLVDKLKKEQSSVDKLEKEKSEFIKRTPFPYLADISGLRELKTDNVTNMS